jgi:hypothetical protein
LAQLEAAGGEAAVGWQLRRVLVRGDGVALDGTERDGSLHLDGTVELGKLAVIDDALASLRGDARLEGTLEGALDAAAINATVHVPALTVEERALGDVTATARWEGAHVTVSAAQIKGFGGTASGTGTLELDEPLTATATITWQGLALRELAGPDADLPAASLDGEGGAHRHAGPAADRRHGVGPRRHTRRRAAGAMEGSGRYAGRRRQRRRRGRAGQRQRRECRRAHRHRRRPRRNAAAARRRSRRARRPRGDPIAAQRARRPRIHRDALRDGARSAL